MLREFSDRVPEKRAANHTQVTVTICVVVLIALATIAGIVGRFGTSEPAVRVDLATLEKQFDENPATGQERYGSKPLEVRAVVRSIDESSVELETVYLLTVTAEFAQPPVGVVRGPIVLECSGIESVAVGGGYKPKLLGCSAQPQPSTARQ